MKIGVRKPSPRKSFAARTTGKAKRRLKKAVNPFYGKKGMGFVKNPKRAVKGAIYRRTTVGVGDIFKAFAPKKKRKKAAAKKAPAMRGEAKKAVAKKVPSRPADVKGEAHDAEAPVAPKKEKAPIKKKDAPQLQQLVHFPFSGAAAIAFFVFGFSAFVFLFRGELQRALTAAVVAVACFVYVGIEADRNRAANEALGAAPEDEPGPDVGDPAC